MTALNFKEYQVPSTRYSVTKNSAFEGGKYNKQKVRFSIVQI